MLHIAAAGVPKMDRVNSVFRVVLSYIMINVCRTVMCSACVLQQQFTVLQSLQQ